VKFILATTEPEKLLPTILSRCQRYDFRNIPTREIAGHLKNICKQEKIKADDDALLMVAKAGAGSMRDSLSLLDRLLSIGEKQLTVETIEQLLGMPKAQAIFDLVQKVGEGDVKAVLNQSSKQIAGGLSTDALLANIIEHLRNLLVLRTCGKDSELVEVPGIAMEDLDAQAQRFDPVVLSQDIAILEELRRNLRSTQAGRALLEATLVRLTLAEQFSSVQDLLAGVSGNGPVKTSAAAPAAAALKKNVEVTVTPPPSPRYSGERGQNAPAQQVAAVTTELQTPIANRKSQIDEDDDLPRPGKVWDNSGPSLAELMKQHESVAPTETTSTEAVVTETMTNVEPVGVASTDLTEIWNSLLGRLHSKGPGLPPLLAGAKLVGIDDGKAVIRFNDPTPARMLDRNGKKEVIRDELSSLLNQSVGVAIEVDETQPAPAAPQPARAPAPPRAPARAVQQPVMMQAPVSQGLRITPELKEELREKNPLIAAIMTELGGEIVKVE
jgi:DNA polymerase III gamma/tau subunit